MVEGDTWKARKSEFYKTSEWIEKVIDIAVKRPRGADVWVGMWSTTLRQALKSRFERSSSIYINALTNISTLVY